MKLRIAAAGLLAALCLMAEDAGKGPGNIAPYYPTPLNVATRMLEIGELQPGELHYDMGSGDGRLVILAARDFGARSIGFELDPKLVESSRRQIVEMELSELASIQEQDLFTADFSKPDLITLYLLPRALDMLRPLLEEQAKKGVRIVSHDFPVPQWTPEETVPHEDEESDFDGLKHAIYLYRR